LYYKRTKLDATAIHPLVSLTAAAEYVSGTIYLSVNIGNWADISTYTPTMSFKQMYESLKSMITHSNMCPKGWDKVGNTFPNWFGYSSWADLNDGAGGPYIHLLGQRFNPPPKTSLMGSQTLNAIVDIMVVSSSKAMSSYWDVLGGGYPRPGIVPWVFVPVDLNKGAGGKYIYLCYKVEERSCYPYSY